MLTSKTSRWALVTAIVLLISICTFSPAQIIYTAVQVIQNAGSSLNGHTTLNFTGGLTVTENVGANRNEAAIATSAALPGSPTTTTQSQADNSTKVATTAYVDLAVSNKTIASGTAALGTGAIVSGGFTLVTVSATGTATTDVVTAGFNGDPTAVTGYVPLTSGMLTIIAYPTANNVNFKVCNNTASSITPGAITLNWRVAR